MSKERHPLMPDESIQKILISTTSRFVGCYESDNFLITHACGNTFPILVVLLDKKRTLFQDQHSFWRLKQKGMRKYLE